MQNIKNERADMAIQIGDKSYEVDSTVEAYINTLTKRLADSKKALETAKGDAIKELRREQELKEMRETATKAGIKVGDKVSYEYLKGVTEALKIADSEPNFKPIENGVNFDNIYVEV